MLSDIITGLQVIKLSSRPHSPKQRMFSDVSAGIDSEGHAANFVETEQIILYEGAMSSFVQVSFPEFLFVTKAL